MAIPELPTRPAPPASESSFGGGTVHTPPSYANTIAGEGVGLWDGRVSAVPWPDNVYMIIEKSSGRALTVAEGGRVVLQDAPSSSASSDGYTSAANGGADSHWLCVESRGYFSLHNPRTGKYLGHDGKRGMRAGAKEPDSWERLIPRLRPEGGYQIMVPQEGYSMWMVTVAEDGKGLALRHHGTTVWEFVKV